jgi:hypothetical protein
VDVLPLPSWLPFPLWLLLPLWEDEGDFVGTATTIAAKIETNRMENFMMTDCLKLKKSGALSFDKRVKIGMEKRL